jgi:dUTP pyrophosphatase
VSREGVRVRIARLPGAEDLELPAPATAGAAGLDLPAALPEPLELAPGARALVPTGFRVAIPAGFEGQVRPRSGLALRHGLTLPNAPGTVDSDYRGELKVILHNAGSEPVVVRRGDRIAQLVIAPVVSAQWEEVGSLDPTDRGEGGFGHTGLEGREYRKGRASESHEDDA